MVLVSNWYLEKKSQRSHRTVHVYFEVRSPYMCSSMLAARRLLLPFASIAMLVQQYRLQTD
jgi:hypothetical protein